MQGRVATGKAQPVPHNARYAKSAHDDDGHATFGLAVEADVARPVKPFSNAPSGTEGVRGFRFGLESEDAGRQAGVADHTDPYMDLQLHAPTNKLSKLGTTPQAQAQGYVPGGPPSWRQPDVEEDSYGLGAELEQPDSSTRPHTVPPQQHSSSAVDSAPHPPYGSTKGTPVAAGKSYGLQAELPREAGSIQSTRHFGMDAELPSSERKPGAGSKPSYSLQGELPSPGRKPAARVAAGKQSYDLEAELPGAERTYAASLQSTTSYGLDAELPSPACKQSARKYGLDAEGGPPERSKAVPRGAARPFGLDAELPSHDRKPATHGVPDKASYGLESELSSTLRRGPTSSTPAKQYGLAAELSVPAQRHLSSTLPAKQYGLDAEISSPATPRRPSHGPPRIQTTFPSPPKTPVHVQKNGKDFTIINRGALQAALANKTGWVEEAAVRAWSTFAKRQLERYVPIPDNMHRRTLSSSKGYRLRIRQVVDLPMKQVQDRTFEFQLAVTLYDEAMGVFYGNTCYSMHNACNHKGAADPGVVDLNFSFDLYFHSAVSDPRCLAVAEVIVLERNSAGVIKGEYSLGWAMLKLYQLEDPAPATAAPELQPGGALGQQASTAHLMAAPLVAGTPRYLLFRSIYGEDLPPPKVVERCHILFQAEAYPPMESYAPLVPEDFLVTYSDVIPGLRRFDQQGHFTSSPKSIISTLAAPMLAPTHHLALTDLKIGIPEALHHALSALNFDPARQEDRIPGQVPAPEARSYMLRLGLHNGRCFIGPQQLVHGFQQHASKGWQELRLQGPPPCFPRVAGDIMVMLLVELLVVPQKDQRAGEALQRALLVGWAASAPFSSIARDGGQAALAEGSVSLDLSAHEGLSIRQRRVLDWRRLLPPATAHECSVPAIEFQLKDADKHGLGKLLAVPFAEDSKAALDQRSRPPSPLRVVSPRIQDGSPFYGSPVHARNSPLQKVDTRGSSYYQPLPDQAQLDPKAGGLSRVLAPAEVSRGAMLQPGGLSELALTMQRQLDLLARTVDDLREERKSLHRSLSAGPASLGQQQFLEDDESPQHQRGQGTLTAEDRARLRSISPTPPTFDRQRFAGSPLPHSPADKNHPSRAVMAQLHEAGAYEGLPSDVQDVLRRQPAGGRPPTAPAHLDVEARDPKVVSDVLLQLMAFRHQGGANSIHSLSSLHFTFQFYHFPPTVTETCHLAACGNDDPDLHMLMPSSHSLRGAGVLLKYVVDGTLQPLSSTQSAAQAARDQHVHFSRYLAARALSIDVWDSVSQLQVGTASVDMQELLRQGREFSEVLLEVPVTSQQGATSGNLSSQAAHSTWEDRGLGSEGGRDAAEQRGTLLLRLINIGREPSDLDSKQAAFDAVQTSRGGGRLKVKVRAAPYTPSSPLAHALTGRPNAFASFLAGTSSGMPGTPFSPYGPGTPFSATMPRSPHSPRSPGWQDDPSSPTFSSPSFSSPSFSETMSPHSPGSQQDASFEEIYNFESRKLSRQRQLQQIRDQGDGKAGRPPSPKPPDKGHQHSLQRQLLADVEAERHRQKRSTVRQQLLRGLLVRQLLRPMYGEVLLYEQELCNPFNREVVLELRISRPDQLAPVSRLGEYKALVAAGVRVHSHASRAVGARGEGDLISRDNKIFLAANESITVPFKLQSFEPPEAYRGSSSHPADQGGHPSPGAQAGGSGGDVQGHIIGVEVFAVDTAMPVMLLELCVAPRPLIIDRTFRLPHPEKELLKHSIALSSLASLPPALAGGRTAGTLAVACSDKDVVVGATSTGQAGGNAEVFIRCKAGAAPEARHMFLLLYSDRPMAKPTEVWQVYIQSLKKVDMAALIGQTSSTSVAIRGSTTSRRVTCYSSHPEELQVNPPSLVLVAGGLSELHLQFCPLTTGRLDVRVNLVDADTRELVNALLVAADAQIPLVTRSFEVEMPVGTLANKRINYTNPYQQHRVFTLRSNQPWLVNFTPPKMELPPSATRPIGVILDGRRARPGTVDVLVFVNDEDDKSEECFKIRVRVQ